jgi:two-component system sensor histidine kinase/response regulator
MKTLLVAEDEFAMLHVLAMMLEAEGFAVKKAGDGEEALDVLRQGGVDLVLADSMMPSLGGAELHARMQAEPTLAAVPFVLMAAEREDTRGVTVPVVRKPLRVSSLVELIQEALGSAP